MPFYKMCNILAAQNFLKQDTTRAESCQLDLGSLRLIFRKREKVKLILKMNKPERGENGRIDRLML